MDQRIINILSKTLGVDCSKVNNPSQQNLTSWDSLAHLNLIIELEAEFNVSFEPEEIAEMTELSTIIRMVESRYES
jgi:acyl carrier protein